MNYESSVRYLLTLGRELAAPTQAAASKFNLENITVLLERLGRPERTFPCVHIAGNEWEGVHGCLLGIDLTAGRIPHRVEYFATPGTN